MNEMHNRISDLCQAKGITIAKMARDLGIRQGLFSDLKREDGRTLSLAYASQISKYLGVSMEYLLTGKEKTPPQVEEFAPSVAEDTVSLNIVGDVAAGYNHIAESNWTGENVDIPRSWLHGRPISDYFALKVVGNSMYPLYMDGDIVIVLRQSTMNRSGEIGVVVYGDELATLKKIEYVMGEDWMKLIPINPSYEPITVTGEDLEHCRVLGVPKMLIRNVAE